MKRLTLFLLPLLLSLQAVAQDDLMNMLNAEAKTKPSPVYATFKSSRLINLHTNENMKAKHLDFRIQHRFSTMQNGAYDLFGLDGATMRFSFEYGVTNRIMLGVGRSTFNKMYDGFIKWQAYRQTTSGIPLSVDLFASTAVNTLTWDDPTRNNFFTSRLSFCLQAILASKVNDHLSLLLNPTVVHYNLVPATSDPNDIYSLGMGASLKISRSARLNLEYIPRLNGREAFKDANGKASYNDVMAIGIDIETGGHVFQLQFTNSTGMVEQIFAARNVNPMTFSELRFGFNLSRTFSFDHNND